MTSPTPSRATLAHVLTAISDAEMSMRRREELASSIRTVARALDRPPADILADPRALACRLDKISATELGLSLGRWANVRSHLRAALSLVKPILPGRSAAPMSAGWCALFEQLPTRCHKARLSKLLRFLSSNDIGPATVQLEHLLEFKRILHEDALVAKPEAVWKDLVWAWNRVGQLVAEWPPLRIEVTPRSDFYRLQWDAFAATFKADVDRYLDRLAGKDLLDDAPFKPVRPATIAARAWQYRAFASALVHQGVPAQQITSLGRLVTEANFKLGLRYFLARNGGGSSTTIAQMAGALLAVARHWVKLPGADLSVIASLTRKLAVPETGMTEKNRARLRPFDDEANVTALLDLPRRLIGEALSGRFPAKVAALKAQTAVLIELSIIRPLRLDNLRSLDREKNLVRPARARKAVHIVIPAQYVKNLVALEHRLPDETAALLATYLDRFHPIACCGKPNTALFPGRDGHGVKSIGAVRDQIVSAARIHTGLHIHPHLFRHIAAKLHLDAHPGEYEIVREVLGHKSLKTTRRAYLGMETDAAVRHFDRTIVELRRRAAAGPRRRPPTLPTTRKKAS